MSVRTLWGWETNRHAPGVRYWRAISEYLGYDLETEEATTAGKLKTLRRQRGWSQRELAKALGVSERTVGVWERGFPMERARRRVGALVERLLEEGDRAGR